MSNEQEHAAMVQKQTLKQQEMEVELALKELNGAGKAYKFVGALLVETDVKTLTEELTRKRESIKARLEALSRHK